MTITLSIALIIVSIFLIVVSITTYRLRQKVYLNESISQLEKRILEDSNVLQEIKDEIKESTEFCDQHQEQAAKLTQQLVDLDKEIKSEQEKLEVYKENAELAYNQFKDGLQKKYEETEQNYESQLSVIQTDLETAQQELENTKKLQQAVREAQIREKQIKDNAKLYQLIPSSDDLLDIVKLDRVKKELNKPRILSMLIWQTYWQPLAKKQFPRILNSTSPVMGIYKITNQVTGECYVGQAVDIDKRWKEHIKCGLGIDTPVGNKLYQAMEEDGIKSFSFEVLEAITDRTMLNERERYFISLYESDKFGYNGTEGNK